MAKFFNLLSIGALMKSPLLALLTVLLIAASSCGPSQPLPLTDQEIAKEKEAIIDVANRYNISSASKDWSGIVELLSKKVTFYGTDSAEVLRNFEEFQAKINQQWDFYDTMIYGDMVDIHIDIDPQGQLASIIFGVPCDIVKGNKAIHYFLRVARTLKKEDGKWVICSGIVGIAKTDNTWKEFNNNTEPEPAEGSKQP